MNINTSGKWSRANQTQSAGETPSSDYINANFIHGHTLERKFIATQGPQTATVNDFWHMIWQKNVSFIIMLAKLIEDGKKKCAQYWPKEIDTNVMYESVTVIFTREEEFADFSVRHFTISKDGNTRQVKMYHFTSWPDQGIPQSAMTMVSFIETVRNQLTNTSQFPLVVHCSAGVGRTGTFIALWNLMDSARDQHMVDVPATVKRLRDSRYKMVQTADQYKFIYHAIAIASQGSLQRLSADNLDALQMMNIHHSRQLLQTLSSISERFDDHNEFSSQPANSNKNRQNAGPFYPEHTLALISTFLPPEGNTYINAAFVDTSLQK